jgi:lysozyme family protein
MKNSYEDCLHWILAHEGGYTNHPADPGGPTNFGITIFDYRKYVKPNATAADVRAMRVDEAKIIYRARYWDAQRCDELPAGVDYVVFDYGVNSGTGRSGKVLRRVLKLPDDSSNVSDAVIAAARAADARALVIAICDERLRFLRSLKTWPVFGLGWGRRVAEVKSAALAMIADTAVPAVPRNSAAGRAVAPASNVARPVSATAVVVAGAAVAQRARQSGMQLTLVVAILAVAFALAVCAWLYWRWRQRWQQERPA